MRYSGHVVRYASGQVSFDFNTREGDIVNGGLLSTTWTFTSLSDQMTEVQNGVKLAYVDVNSCTTFQAIYNLISPNTYKIIGRGNIGNQENTALKNSGILTNPFYNYTYVRFRMLEDRTMLVTATMHNGEGIRECKVYNTNGTWYVTSWVDVSALNDQLESVKISSGTVTTVKELTTSGTNYNYTVESDGWYTIKVATGSTSGTAFGRLSIGNTIIMNISVSVGTYDTFMPSPMFLKNGTAIKAMAGFPANASGNLVKIA